MTTDFQIPFCDPAGLRVSLAPMPANPKVSVLVTNYNYEEFLPRAIESVLAQSWRPLEIIVSDDGSEDRSCAAVQSYVDRGHPVVLVRGVHRGMAGCLNAAFAASSGEVICLLDADDYFFAGKLDAVVNAFRSNPGAGFCIHRCERINQRGRMGGAFPLFQQLPSGDRMKATVSNSGVLMGLPPTSALSLRRNVASKIFPISEDYLGYAEQVIHRLAPLITSICCVEETLSSWTLHSRNDANSSRVKIERLERELRFMEMLWQEQHRFLLDCNPMLALELRPLQQSSLYVKMRYIVGRLTADENTLVNHKVLCSLPEIRSSYMGMFWRYSDRLPRPIFRKLIDLLETQGSLKHLFGRFLGRESSMNYVEDHAQNF